MHFGRNKKRFVCSFQFQLFSNWVWQKELTRVALKCIDEQIIRLGAVQVFFSALTLLLFSPLFFRLTVPLWALVTWDKQASAAGAGGGRANSAIAAIASSTAANYDESNRAQAQPPGTPYIYTYTYTYVYYM